MSKHAPLYPKQVLYPVTLPAPATRAAIERAISAVVERMRPRSLCQCGEFCALDKKLRQRVKGQIEMSRSGRAIKECAEWLSYCLSIGWPKSSLDRLEALWWEYHDDYGRLKGKSQ
jgi:hypothetical protein